MESSNLIRKASVFLGALTIAAVMSTSAFAQHAGGHMGGAGGHFGGGAHVGGGAQFGGGHVGAYGGGYHGGYSGYHGAYYGGYGGYHGAYYGGYGPYGWRGGYGWHGGWGWGCCGWGWGWGGLGLGLYFASLPLYYQTYWWNGVPYYYADNTYYLYDPNAKQYETVAPPTGLAGQTPTGGVARDSELIAYPKNGQTPEQESQDKYECHKWAVGQTGYDPTTGAAAPAAKRPDYMRAQAACLEGRGYSVE